MSPLEFPGRAQAQEIMYSKPLGVGSRSSLWSGYTVMLLALKSITSPVGFPGA